MTSSPTVYDPDELRIRRLILRWDQSDLAERSGLDQSYISLLERGKRQPSAETLGRLADALGCEIDDLMINRDRRRPKKAAAAVPAATAGRAA